MHKCDDGAKGKGKFEVSDFKIAMISKNALTVILLY